MLPIVVAGSESCSCRDFAIQVSAAAAAGTHDTAALCSGHVLGCSRKLSGVDATGLALPCQQALASTPPCRPP